MQLENAYFLTKVETNDWLKISPLVKIPQFLSNQADIQAILPTQEPLLKSQIKQSFMWIVMKLWIF